jgi:predicted AlkP superfamily phosphohydrolase/phosphomutase
MPGTYPPTEINGLMVSGIGGGTTDESDFTRPKEAKEKIKDKYNYRVLPRNSVNGRPTSDEKYIQVVGAMIKNKMDLVKDRLTTDQFVHLTISRSDDIQHHYWQDYYKKTKLAYAIPQIWQVIDGEIKKIIDKYPDLNIIIMSDHGFTELKGTFDVNSWLEKRGLIKRTSGSRTITNKIKKIFIDSPLRKLLPMDLLRKLKFLKKGSKALPSVDWDQTKALALSEGLIYINRSKLTQQGYNKLVNRLKQDLVEIVHPNTKERVVEKVFHKNEIYSGNQLKKSPDLILVQNDGYELKASFEREFKLPKDDQWKANHRIMGMFLAYGKNINNKKKYKQYFSIYDLAPTILNYYNIRANNCDGDIIDILTT